MDSARLVKLCCRLLAVLSLTPLAACSLWSPQPAAQIPTIEIPAREPSRENLLVIVLPGRGDDVENLRDSGIATLIQSALPHARVTLVGAQLQYYRDGQQVPRLQSQLIEPALAAGVQEIWMVGTSLGGFGSMLYDYEHPGVLAGIVLLAPFTGDPANLVTLAASGGPQHWPASDEGPPRTFDVAGRAIWRLVRQWSEAPTRSARVWLGCGSDDKFIDAARQIASVLPAGHYVEVPGGHDHKTWSLAARELFIRIRAQRLAAASR